MRLRHCPPSLPSPLLTLLHPHLICSLAYNPYTASGPSSYASKAALSPPYASSHPLNMPPMLLTILTLAVPSHWPDPYVPAAPHLHPHHPCLFFSAAYNSYAPAAPSRYASDATLNPPLRLILFPPLTILMLRY
ncbi:hypothetical protein O181_046750 [Austropuccinia psidii MF-1]|uniref:Uncharacterized protein n=1 Tax=Austropuccinia psidii MF-1 TaxID=1389203 RepID=A0A9Q3DU04_9BASI|nr:hypothetical protein [Austropuccinia psidii MF-1]